MVNWFSTSLRTTGGVSQTDAFAAIARGVKIISPSTNAVLGNGMKVAMFRPLGRGGLVALAARENEGLVATAPMMATFVAITSRFLYLTTRRISPARSNF
jgi:hypothetical protein